MLPILFDIGEPGLSLLEKIRASCNEADGATSRLSASDYRTYLSDVNQVLQFGQIANKRCLSDARFAACQASKQLGHDLYAAFVSILDCYDFLKFDLQQYCCRGGGAMLVLCKRSIISFYVSVIQLHLILSESCQ
jgi:hypothetical protein